jgi:hypothetical protein
MSFPFPCAAGHWHSEESISLIRFPFSWVSECCCIVGMEETQCIYHYLTNCLLRICVSSPPLNIKLISFCAATDVKEDGDKQVI